MDHFSEEPFCSGWPEWLDANAARYLLFARSQTRCEADAQDLLQDALVEAWRRNGGKDGEPPDDALVFRTIRRRAIDLWRRTERRERREQSAPEWWTTASHEPELDAELERAVKTLPVQLREVLVLKVWGELTFREIATALDVPPGTAATRYRCALDQLRTIFKEARS